MLFIWKSIIQPPQFNISQFISNFPNRKIFRKRKEVIQNGISKIKIEVSRRKEDKGRRNEGRELQRGRGIKKERKEGRKEERGKRTTKGEGREGGKKGRREEEEGIEEKGKWKRDNQKRGRDERKKGGGGRNRRKGKEE